MVHSTWSTHSDEVPARHPSVLPDISQSVSAAAVIASQPPIYSFIPRHSQDLTGGPLTVNEQRARSIERNLPASSRRARSSGSLNTRGFNSSSSMRRRGSLRTALPASSAPTTSTTSRASNMVLHGLGGNTHDPTVNPFVPIAASSLTAFILYLLPFTVRSFLLLFYIVFALLIILYI
jgi:hypothetical protein